MVKLEEQLPAIRAAVADALAARGHGNREFIRQVRAGEQDDGPFMVGALAGWAARAQDGAGGDATDMDGGGE